MARRVILGLIAAAVLAAGCAEATGERRLVSIREDDLEPGHVDATLVYVEARDVRLSDIYVHDLATDERERIRGLPEGYRNSPAWSPDGERIAFALSGEDGFSHIWTVGADGSDPRQITEGEVLDDHPRWSPDGEELVFSSIRDGSHDWHLFRVSADGGEVDRLPDDDSHSLFPDWSPDGRMIVYANRDGDHYKLRLLDLETGEDRALTDGPSDERNPRFSPDGEHVIFTSNRVDEIWQLFEIDLATEEIHHLTPSDTFDEFPAYSPDMEYVALSAGHIAVYRIEDRTMGVLPDGNWRWQLTVNLAWAPDWKPQR